MDIPNKKECARCGGELIELTQSTRSLGNSQFPSRNTTYKCSNSVCQQEIDKKVADWELQKQDRLAKAEKNRAEKADRSKALGITT